MAKASRNYRQLSGELDNILGRLQDPSTSIDEALELNTKGQKLITELEAYLRNAKNSIKAVGKGKV